MKALAVVLSLALAGSVFGQAVSRGFGSVVFPGGASSGASGVTRSFGSVVFPGGMQSQPVYGPASVIGIRPGVGVPGAVPPSNFHRYPATGHGTRGAAPAYVYIPVYVGGYDYSYAPQEAAPPPQQAVPVMIQAGPDGEYYTTPAPRQPVPIYQAQRQPETVDEPEPASVATPYLLAFKDHTILSAVAYWADGDTLHYFTTGSTHNQVSLSLLDRDLTDRLNRELGTDFKLPPAK
jgi:hypothetical protein